MKNMEYKDKVVIVTGGAQAAITIDTTNLCSHLQKSCLNLREYIILSGKPCRTMRS